MNAHKPHTEGKEILYHVLRAGSKLQIFFSPMLAGENSCLKNAYMEPNHSIVLQWADRPSPDKTSPGVQGQFCFKPAVGRAAAPHQGTSLWHESHQHGQEWVWGHQREVVREKVWAHLNSNPAEVTDQHQGSNPSTLARFSCFKGKNPESPWRKSAEVHFPGFPWGW